VDELDAGPLFRFADWPNAQVPRRAAGVYTIWRGEDFIYVGMSGRGAQREDLVAVPGRHSAPKGLWTRLNSHASGRRSGDQFNVYVCDRFIVPVLTLGQQRDIGAGHLLLDQMTRDFIRATFSYRFIIHDDGNQGPSASSRLCGQAACPKGGPTSTRCDGSCPLLRQGLARSCRTGIHRVAGSRKQRTLGRAAAAPRSSHRL
jgi:hypothetical protein